MRLTLRTLLAWLDDAPMSQAQRKELKEKVVSSESARKLLEHLKAVESNRQIVAPQIDGQGNKDANVTGEYLDGVLDEALVAQFEKSCLESDSLLAEVAGVHAALASILRQDKIKITSSMRERSYKIGRVMSRSAEETEFADSTPNSSDSSISHGTDGEVFVDRELQNESEFDLAPPDDGGEKKVTSFMEHLQQDLEGIAEEDQHSKPRLADSQPKSNLPKILIAGIAAIVLVGAGIGIGTLMQQGNDSVANNQGKQDKDEKETTNKDNDNSGTNGAGGQNESTDDNTGDGTIDNQGESSNVNGSSNDNNSADDSSENNNSANNNAGNSGDGDAGSGNIGDGQQAQGTEAQNGDGTNTEPSPDGNNKIVGHVASDLPPAPLDKANSDIAENKVADVKETVIPDRAQWPVTQLAEGGVAGVVGAGDQMLLRKSEPFWEVLSVDQEIRQGDVLFVPAGFRPSISLPTANIQLIGPARVTVGPPQSEQGPAHLFVYSGQVMVTPALEAGDSIRMTIADHTGDLVFTDRNSVVAATVDRQTEFRNDTFFAKSVVVRMTSTRGRAIWKDELNPVAIDPNNVIEYVGTEPANKIEVTAPPAWLPKELSKIDQDAAVNIRRAIGNDVDPVLQLESFLTDARIENRYLAARALCSWQNYRGLFLLFNDRTNKTYWTRMLDDLRDEVNSFEPSATAMQKYLESDPDGEAVLRMVVGFDDKQLAAGGDGTLVAALSDNRLLMRVLAIENLRRVTGSTYLYRPESQEKTRAKYVRQWRRQLDRGEIRHKVNE